MRTIFQLNSMQSGRHTAEEAKDQKKKGMMAEKKGQPT